MLPPTLDSQTVREPISSASLRRAACLCAADSGHNLALLFELVLTEMKWKRAVKEISTTNNGKQTHAAQKYSRFDPFHVSTLVAEVTIPSARPG